MVAKPARMPKTARLVLAGLLIVLGVALFLTPFPGGLFLVMTGLLMACCDADNRPCHREAVPSKTRKRVVSRPK